jgi:hypothetical protein
MAVIMALVEAVAISGVAMVALKADIEAATAVAITAIATGRSASSAENPIAG